MASSSTPKVTYKHNARQRLEVAEVDLQTEIAKDLDAELGYCALADDGVVIYGFDVSFNASKTFDVADGSAFFEGEAVKLTGGPSAVILNDGDATHPRIDYVVISTTAQGNTTNANKIVLSAIARTAVAAEAVGTGDGSTIAWDLANSGVDIKTLKVQIAAVADGGWALSPGTGTAGVDQIIFHDPPANPDAITADYTYQSGGVEASTNVSTRYEWLPSITVIEGTPRTSPPPAAPAVPAGQVRLATITVPAAWTGGSITPDNSVKMWFLHGDRSADAQNPGVAPNSGKVSHVLRGISQVTHGYRLRCGRDPVTGLPTDVIKITPGWASNDGRACRDLTEVSYTIQAADVSGGARWYYVYGDMGTAGGGITVKIHTAAPTDMMRGNTAGWFYIGAIYVTSNSPITVRPFYTHGDWVYWEDPTIVTPGMTIPQASFTDLDIATWCPPQGRLVEAELYLSIQDSSGSGAVGDIIDCEIRSHLAATAKHYPRIVGQAALVRVTGTDPKYTSYTYGKLRPETSGATRNVKYQISIDPDPTAGNNHEADLRIFGYLDDYRTLDASGQPTFY